MSVRRLRKKTLQERRSKPPRVQLIQAAQRLQTVRDLRIDRFPATAGDGSAWDLLLVIFIAQEQGEPIGVTRAGIAAGISATSSLRYVDKLEAAGSIERWASPKNARLTLLRLSPAASAQMVRFLKRVAQLWS